MTEADDKYKAPSRSELINQAMDWLKENLSKKELKEMTLDELQGLAKMKANATIDHANNLIKSGVWAGQAWNWAIRAEICGVEYD